MTFVKEWQGVPLWQVQGPLQWGLAVWEEDWLQHKKQGKVGIYNHEQCRELVDGKLQREHMRDEG